MARFSKYYPSFFDWLNVHPNAGTSQATTYEKRIVRAQIKGKNLSGARGHGKRMYRKVLGGTIPINKNGEKKKYYSLSIYGFKDSKFTDDDVNKLESILQRETVNHFYPESQYDETDFWGRSWIRETENDSVSYDGNKIGKWFFHTDGKNQTEGFLSEK